MGLYAVALDNGMYLLREDEMHTCLCSVNGWDKFRECVKNIVIKYSKKGYPIVRYSIPNDITLNYLLRAFSSLDMQLQRDLQDIIEEAEVEVRKNTPLLKNKRKMLKVATNEGMTTAPKKRLISNKPTK